jgi:hypothetical protein
MVTLTKADSSGAITTLQIDTTSRSINVNGENWGRYNAGETLEHYVSDCIAKGFVRAFA